MEKKIEFKVKNNILRGSLFIPEGKGPFPAVILFHGNGGKGASTFEAASKLPQIGILSFAFNFTECGISDGDYSIQTHQDALDDAIAEFNVLFSQNIDKNRIGVVGGSFGGYIASMLLPKFNIKSLVLRAPSACTHNPKDMLDMGDLQHEVDYFKNKGNWVNSESYVNISNFKGQLLIIKSEHDDNVPSHIVDLYFDKARNAKIREMKVIKDADHRLTKDVWKDEFFSIIHDWFSKTL